MKLEYSSISNLLLLPKNFSIEKHDPLVSEILDSHHVFHPLYELEKSIQPILESMEKRGLVISEEWSRSGLEGKQTQLAKVITEG